MEEKICKHCGQLLMPGHDCDCHGAVMEARTEMQKAKVRDVISTYFGEACTEAGYEPVSEEELIVLKMIADFACEQKLISASVTLSGGIKAKFSRSTDGSIKIERSESKKAKDEIGFWSN